jgi:hypothetical protein
MMNFIPKSNFILKSFLFYFITLLFLGSCRKSDDAFNTQESSTFQTDPLAVAKNAESVGSMVSQKKRCKKLKSFTQYFGYSSVFYDATCSKFEDSEVDESKIEDVEETFNEKESPNLEKNAYYNPIDFETYPELYAFDKKTFSFKETEFRKSVKNKILNNYHKTKCQEILDLHPLTSEEEAKTLGYEIYTLNYRLGGDDLAPFFRSSLVTVPISSMNHYASPLLVYAHAFSATGSGLSFEEVKNAVTSFFLKSHISISPAFRGQPIYAFEITKEGTISVNTSKALKGTYQTELKASQTNWLDDYAYELLGAQDCMAHIAKLSASYTHEKHSHDIDEQSYLSKPLRMKKEEIEAREKLYADFKAKLELKPFLTMKRTIKKDETYLTKLLLNLKDAKKLQKQHSLLTDEEFQAVERLYDLLSQPDLSQVFPNFEIQYNSDKKFLDNSLSSYMGPLKKQKDEVETPLKASDLKSDITKRKQNRLPALDHFKDSSSSVILLPELKKRLGHVFQNKFSFIGPSKDIHCSPLDPFHEVLQKHKVSAPQTFLVGVDLGATLAVLASEYDGIFLESKKVPHFISLLRADMAPSTFVKGRALRYLDSAFMSETTDSKMVLFPGYEHLFHKVHSYVEASDGQSEHRLQDLTLSLAMADTTYLIAFLPKGLKNWSDALKPKNPLTCDLVSLKEAPGSVVLIHNIEDVLVSSRESERLGFLLSHMKEDPLIVDVLMYQPPKSYYKKRTPNEDFVTFENGKAHYERFNRKHPDTGLYFANIDNGNSDLNIAHGLDDAYLKSFLINPLNHKMFDFLPSINFDQLSPTDQNQALIKLADDIEQETFKRMKSLFLGISQYSYKEERLVFCEGPMAARSFQKSLESLVNFSFTALKFTLGTPSNDEEGQDADIKENPCEDEEKPTLNILGSYSVVASSSKAHGLEELLILQSQDTPVLLSWKASKLLTFLETSLPELKNEILTFKDLLPQQGTSPISFQNIEEEQKALIALLQEKEGSLTEDDFKAKQNLALSILNLLKPLFPSEQDAFSALEAIVSSYISNHLPLEDIKKYDSDYRRLDALHNNVNKLLEYLSNPYFNDYNEFTARFIATITPFMPDDLIQALSSQNPKTNLEAKAKILALVDLFEVMIKNLAHLGEKDVWYTTIYSLCGQKHSAMIRKAIHVLIKCEGYPIFSILHDYSKNFLNSKRTQDFVGSLNEDYSKKYRVISEKQTTNSGKLPFIPVSLEEGMAYWMLSREATYFENLNSFGLSQVLQ